MTDSGKRAVALGSTFMALWATSMVVSLLGDGDIWLGFTVPFAPVIVVGHSGDAALAQAALLGITVYTIYVAVKIACSLALGLLAYIALGVYFFSCWAVVLATVRY